MSVIICEQLNLFDLLKPPMSKPKPLLSSGQKIFVVSLDRAIPAIVSDAYICHEKSDNPYYGYHIKCESEVGGCVWDYDIGARVFADEAQALAKASLCSFPRINPKDLIFVDSAAYQYSRNSDSHILKAFIAKIGENRLYERDFYCYHFLRFYKTQKDRDKAYKKILAKITRESETHNGTPDETPILEDLYYVSDSLYASREYAERHSVLLNQQ